MTKHIIIYSTATGIAPFREYLESLRDRQAAVKIKTRVTRAQMGNFGDHRSVGEGVIELRINFGPGYRVYLAQQGDIVIVLLCAGDKHSQQKDIANAYEYWKDFKRTQ